PCFPRGSDRAEPGRRAAPAVLAVQLRRIRRDRPGVDVTSRRAVENPRRRGAERQARLSRQGTDRPPLQHRYAAALSPARPPPLPYRVSALVRCLDQAMGSLNRPESVAAYQLVKTRILALQNDVRFGFMFGTSLTLRDEMSDILAQLFRIPVSGKPITILDLSG